MDIFILPVAQLLAAFGQLPAASSPSVLPLSVSHHTSASPLGPYTAVHHSFFFPLPSNSGQVESPLIQVGGARERARRWQMPAWLVSLSPHAVVRRAGPGPLSLPMPAVGRAAEPSYPCCGPGCRDVSSARQRSSLSSVVRSETSNMG